MMTNFGSTSSSRRRSKSRIKQQTEPPSDYAATPQRPSSLEVSNLSPHYMKATSSFEGKKGHIQASPHSSESSFDSSDQSWSPSSNKSSSKSKRSNSNCQQVSVKSTCSSTLKDSKFPQRVEVHPGQSESDRISKVKVCSYHHCSLNRRCDDPSAPIKLVFRKRRVLKSQKSIRLEGESTNADHFSADVTSLGAQVHKGSNLIQDGGVFGVNEAIEYADLVEIVFGETSFPERSYQETIDIMRKYSAQEQDTLLNTTSKCCNSMEREWDESTSVSDYVESYDQSVTTPVFRNDEERDADFNVTTCEEEENIKKEMSKNEPFAIRTTSLTDDFVEAKCCTEFPSASASIARMELEESLQETDGKANPTEDVDPNALAKKLHVAQFPKEKHRSMWSLFHRHMISDESTELDSKVIRGDDEEYHKDGCNKSCAAESSDSFLSFSERESMTTNQDANSQEIEARKLLAIKLVREAIERILLPEVQDQSSDNQSVTSEVCTEENSNESDTKNEECDKAGNITRENTGSPEKQENEEQVTNKAEKKAPTHWSNLKRWILLQRFIKELEKLRKFNPRKPQYLQLEPDPEAEKVNLKHQIEDERKSAEEWMLDYALQQAISQLALTQKRKVGLLVTAFENVVPPRGSNIQVTFPKLKTRNDNNLQIADKVREKYSTRLDKRNADDNWSMLEYDDAQKALVLCQKLDEVTSTSSDKVLVEEKAKRQAKEDGRSKLEREARINVSKASHKKEKFGDSNDDSLRGTSSTITKLGNNSDETQENNMDLSECEATESITASSDENKKLTEAEDEDGTNRKQVNKQKHISMWHMISQQILPDVVSKVGSELLDGTNDEVDHNKTLAETNTDSSLHDFSEEKDDISHCGRSFSRNDAVNLIREAVSQILTTPTKDDSSDTQSVTSDIVQDEEPGKTDHTEAEKQNNTNSLCESLRHCDSQQTNELAANNTITKNKFEPPKSKNWSKLKKLILLKRSIKALERARKLNPQPPQLLLPSLPDQEKEKVDLRNQMTDERRKAEQWLLDNAVQHMVSKLTPTRKTRVAMLVEAFEAVVPFPEV
ncbi:calmodulin binding protein PICBP-like [Solanum dulcamara]|uniref:calmodulin binding protein PICBP-like n=1 Tax=Solanum dulcamara TaxID=45834 RepID=UPI0024867AAD|nr:calmodulin binding protein PICBP-like [Solanum dulcamara]